jgi:hypothetical protein
MVESLTQNHKIILNHTLHNIPFPFIKHSQKSVLKLTTSQIRYKIKHWELLLHSMGPHVLGTLVTAGTLETGQHVN